MGSSAPYRVHRKPGRSGKKRAMAPQRVLGIVLIVAGAGLLAFGFSLARSGDAAGGAATAVHAATWYVMSGIGVALAGFILAVLGIRRADPGG